MSRSTILEPLAIKRSKRRRLLFTAKVGGTAGWVVNAATDVSRMATMAASQTAGTLVVPITGLAVGDRITGFHLVGQIESGGNAVTVDAALKKTTAAAADIANAAVTGGAMTQVSVTADTQLDRSNAYKELTTPEVVGEGNGYYILITATTLGSTDIDLIGVDVEVQEM